jgi:predicted nucleotidyltransferase
MREIERETGFAIGTIQSELKKLANLDLIIKEKHGNRCYYSANSEHPIYPEICSLVIKTIGVADILRTALAPSEKIAIAFIFGSLARSEEKSHSDVDLFVIGGISLRELSKLLFGVAERVGREINPHTMTKIEFRKRIETKDHFAMNLVDSEKIFLIGDSGDFEAMAGQRLASSTPNQQK